jgi:hypothetical protein
MVVMTMMVIVIFTAVFGSVMNRVGVMRVIRVTCAGNAGVPGS